MADPVRIGVSTIGGAILWLDEPTYTVTDQDEPLQGPRTPRRRLVNSIMVDDDVIVGMTQGPRSGRMQVRVEDNTDTAVRAAVDAVTAILDEIEWSLVIETSVTETWRCKVADWSVSRTWQGYWDSTKALLTASFLVAPDST